MIQVLIQINDISSTPNCFHVNIIIFLVFHYFKFSLYSIYLLTFYFYNLLYTLKLSFHFIATIILLFTYKMSFTDDSDLFVVFFGVRCVEFKWSNIFNYLTLLSHRVIIIRILILISISLVCFMLNLIKLVLVNFYSWGFFMLLMHDWILLFILLYWL